MTEEKAQEALSYMGLSFSEDFTFDDLKRDRDKRIKARSGRLA
jgi:hypothetical protein